MAYKADGITMQVIRYAMEQIADEMGYTLVRTARSTVIKEIMDISCAVADAQGRTIAQAHHAPMLLTGLEVTMHFLVDFFKDKELNEGDVILSNDPYLGGQHIMDMQVFAPVFFAGKLIGFVGSLAHQVDMGGSTPGGVAGGMTEIYHEGIRLSFVKFHKRGVEDPEITGILRNNIRIPDVTLGDIRAQASATLVGVRRMQQVYAKYGAEVVDECVRMLMDYSESRMREGLRKFPDGYYSGVDFSDDDGVTDDPVRIQVNLRKEGDHASVDFAGSSQQVRGNVNCPLATSHASVYYALIAVIDPHMPANHGCYRPVEIHAEPGTIVNPLLPGAVAARTQISQKIVEALMKALADAVPERVVAGSHGQVFTCAFGGYYPGTKRRFSFTEIQGGGAGARPHKDGKDGQDSHLARFMNTPVEAAEMEYPIRVEQYEFRTDAGGAGKYRGGLSMIKDIRLLADNMTFARYSDRQHFAPFGLFGGHEGVKSQLILNPGQPNERSLKSKGLDTLHLNDLVSIRLPGAGGYGDPLERDLNALIRDVRDGKVSLEAARSEYQVALNPDLTVNQEETAALRREAGVA